MVENQKGLEFILAQLQEALRLAQEANADSLCYMLELAIGEAELELQKRN